MKKKILLFCTALSALTTVILMTACTKAEFDVRFITNSEVYTAVSTNGNETLELPVAPHLDGCEFDGWYLDNGIWATRFTENSLLGITLSGNVNVYAKFKHNKHSFNSATLVSPTCTEAGYTVKECKCGAEQKSNYILSTEHTYGEFVIRKKPTSYSSGIKERICTLCGKVDTVTLPVLSYGDIIYDSNLNFDYTYDTSNTPDTSYSPTLDYYTAFEELHVNIEEQSVYVMPDEESDYNSTASIGGYISEALKDNGIIIADLDTYDIYVYIEDENGEYIPVPLEELM